MTEKTKNKQQIRDLREYSSQTNMRLIIGGIFLLLVVGLGLIYLIFGNGAVFSAFLCILAGFFPLFLIYISFLIIDLIIKKNRQ